MIYKVTPTLATRQRWIRRDVDRARKGPHYVMPKGLTKEEQVKWFKEVLCGGKRDIR